MIHLKPAHRVAIGGSIITAIIAFTSPFEGESHTAYRDIARPDIWTICMGETQGVHQGMTMTHDQCVAKMAERVPAYLGPVDKFMPGLSRNARIAYADFAWNEGAGALTRRSKNAEGVRITGTSIVDMEKVGNHAGACARLLEFNTANGKVYPGLDTRRKAENALCLQD